MVASARLSLLRSSSVSLQGPVREIPKRRPWRDGTTPHVGLLPGSRHSQSGLGPAWMRVMQFSPPGGIPLGCRSPKQLVAWTGSPQLGELKLWQPTPSCRRDKPSSWLPSCSQGAWPFLLEEAGGGTHQCFWSVRLGSEPTVLTECSCSSAGLCQET